MDDDRSVHLLGEIRDLQRQHLEAYGRALANQREALRIQREGLGRARKLMAGVAVVLVVMLVVVLEPLKYVLEHYR